MKSKKDRKKKAGFIPNKYQQAIYDFITHGKGNAVVSSVAGSGKTTTLLNAIGLIHEKKDVMFMAFNRSIARELVQKIPEAKNINIRTVHGYGLDCLIKEYGIITLTDNFENEIVDVHKYRAMLRKIMDYRTKGNLSGIAVYNFREWQLDFVHEMNFNVFKNKKTSRAYFENIIKLCNLGRLNLADISDSGKGMRQMLEISEKHDVKFIENECELALSLMKIGSSVVSKIDFTDMIYMPIMHNLSIRQFDFIFVDECQDLNSCQLVLMKMAIKPGGRFIAVGDEHQAIYGFAGADTESYDKLCKIPDTIILPLSVCYRCDKNIVDLAKTLVPHIEARLDAGNGIIDDSSSYKNIRSGDMVLCRQTFPLVALCLKYLSQSTKAFVLGFDIVKVLSKMIADTYTYEDWNMNNVLKCLSIEKEEIIKKLIRNRNFTEKKARESKEIDEYEEKVNIIELLSVGIDNPQKVIEKMEFVFRDSPTEGICLSTVHKAKGLEADRVFIIHHDLMPSRKAEKVWEIVQERNIMYVAYTRARHVLGFVDDFDAFEERRIRMEDKRNGIIHSPATQPHPMHKSKFKGTIGQQIYVELEVRDIHKVFKKYGESLVYELIDKEGNMFHRYGNIDSSFIVSEHEKVERGSIVKFYAKVNLHKFDGTVMITVLSGLVGENSLLKKQQKTTKPEIQMVVEKKENSEHKQFNIFDNNL